MVTMYFIYLYTYSDSVQMIPHQLPLFKDKAQCEVVVDEIKEVAPYGATSFKREIFRNYLDFRAV